MSRKLKIFRAFRDKLEQQLASIERTQGSAVAGTRVDGDHRPSNRGERGAVTSQAYLAMGLARRAEEIRHALEVLKLVPPDVRTRLANGALAEVEDENGEQRMIMVLPGGQGDVLRVDGFEITVLSSKAPMLQDLLGKEEGEAGRVQRGEDWIEVEITHLE